MAVTFKTREESRSNIYNFDPKNIKIIPHLTGRKELTDIDTLAADIAANGQVEPIEIRKEAGNPVLVAGHRRLLAILHINKNKLTPVPLTVKCTYFDGNEFEAFKRTIAENGTPESGIRVAPSIIDIAHCVGQLKAWNQTDEQIATLYHKRKDDNTPDTRWVKKMLKVNALTPEAQAALSGGQMKPSAIEHFTKMDAEHQRERVAAAGDEPITGASSAPPKPSKPNAKTVFAQVTRTRDDTTAPKAVRRYCEELAAFMEGGVAPSGFEAE